MENLVQIHSSHWFSSITEFRDSFHDCFDQDWKPHVGISQCVTMWIITISLIKREEGINHNRSISIIHKEPHWINIVDRWLDDPDDDFRLQVKNNFEKLDEWDWPAHGVLVRDDFVFVVGWENVHACIGGNFYPVHLFSDWEIYLKVVAYILRCIWFGELVIEGTIGWGNVLYIW